MISYIMGYKLHIELRERILLNFKNILNFRFLNFNLNMLSFIIESVKFTNHIVKKYVLYASLATIIGSLIGVCIGFYVIPKVIFSMYSLMYSIGEIQGRNLSILMNCVWMAIFLLCNKILKEKFYAQYLCDYPCLSGGKVFEKMCGKRREADFFRLGTAAD